MAPKVLILGATGYIGGDALVTIIKAHPDWDITASVRNSDKGAKVAALLPSVKLVYGDLDSVDLIEEEASKVDIVYHLANCDHEASAHAIVKGLARRTSEGPGFYIHTSGAMILATETIKGNSYGDYLPKVFDDWEGVTELTHQPDDAAHRVVDKIVLEASLNPRIKTAIVCPPAIFGIGRGPDRQKSVQVYMTAKLILQQGIGVQIGKGQNVWNEVHVHDLSDLYLKLGEAAAAGGPPATWNDQGYYLAENGEFVWGDVCKDITNDAYKRGLISSKEVVALSSSDAASLDPWLEKLIGTNSRGKGIRANKLLGWQPKARMLKDELSDIVEMEAKELNLIKGHAAKVEE